MNKVPLNITTSVFKCSIREPLGTFYIQSKISHMSLPNEITVSCLFVCLLVCMFFWTKEAYSSFGKEMHIVTGSSLNV